MPFLKKLKVKLGEDMLPIRDICWAGHPQGTLGEGGGEDPWYKGPPGHVRASHSPALGQVSRNTVEPRENSGIFN